MHQGFKAGSEARSPLHLEQLFSMRWLRAGLSGDGGLTLQPAPAPVTLPGLASSLPLTPSSFWPLLLLIVHTSTLLSQFSLLAAWNVIPGLFSLLELTHLQNLSDTCCSCLPTPAGCIAAPNSSVVQIAPSRVWLSLAPTHVASHLTAPCLSFLIHINALLLWWL